MTKQLLKLISDTLQAKNIDYAFQEWTTDPVPDPYFIGEYSEFEQADEDGMQGATFMLTGTSRTWIDLENAKEAIKNTFPPVGGLTAILPNGNGVAIFYSDSFQVPTGDAELKRIQINLTTIEWSVN